MMLSAKNKRVGLLDLDLFGPSVPKLMGLDGAGEPELTLRELAHQHRLDIEPDDVVCRKRPHTPRESRHFVHVDGLSATSCRAK